MATDYDAPRRNESDDLAEDSLEELKARRNENQSGVVDVDETDTAESFENTMNRGMRPATLASTWPTQVVCG